MSRSKAKVSFELKRLSNFFKIFRGNRRGMLGIIILIFFSILALSAGVLTPFEPTDEYISGDFALPFWFKQTIPNLAYSENFNMLTDAGFPTPTSLLEDWTLTIGPTSSARVSLEYDHTVGAKQPGSAAITFTRDPGKYAGDIAEVHLKKQFSFPHNGPPKRFGAKLSWMAEDIESLQQIEMALFIHRIEADTQQLTTYPVWTYKIYRSSTKWLQPYPPIDSYHSSVKDLVGNITDDPAKIIFKPQTDYIYDLRIRLVDSRETLGRVEAVLYIDDLDIKFYGTLFGLLGTDHRGRDIFTHLAHGARISLFVGLLSALVSVVIGLTIGLMAGYLGTIVDEFMMRFTDMLLVLPSLPLLIVLIAVLGPSIYNLILLIGLLGWMGFARMVRSQVLSLKERPFIEAAKAVGAGKFHIILRHILPNVMSLVYVTLALSVPSAILSEAALSWLGLFDPRVVSWGRMLHEAQFEQGIDKWWWIVPPGISIAAVALSFILIGYALDEILNPKLRQRR